MKRKIMANLIILNISLNDREIGTLAQLPGDRNLFVFNQDYIDDAAINRPTLSLSFKDITGGLITEIKPRQTRLPPFFSNLLPEGKMRDYLARRAGIKSQREFFLLWMLGGDLPGAIKALPVDGAKLPDLIRDNIQKTQLANDQEQPALRFSLAGVQLKFSAIKTARGGLTIPANGVGGSWIVKLPDTQFKNVPENELSMMALARRVGIDVPETALVPLKEIAGLPKNIAQTGTHAYAIKRFDRKEDGRRIHMEDFAQIFGVYPEKKYATASYSNIAQVIWQETGKEGIIEFIRRLVFNALIGNGDMHLKNWSLIYPDGHKPALAPAYDFVSTVPYLPNDKMALRFVDNKNFNSLTLNQFKRFAAKIRLPEKLVLDTMSETVELFSQQWTSVENLGVSKKVKKAIDKHLGTIPLWADPH
jgi:serine/threonine-protein kinase HipA